MPPEISDPPAAEHRSDLFDELRDHANQWDMSVLWPDRQPNPMQEERDHPAEGESQ